MADRVKILLSHWDPYNFGDRAITFGALRALRESIPDADITVSLPAPEIERQNYNRYSVKVVKTPWLIGYGKTTNLFNKLFCFGMPALFLLLNCSLRRLLKLLNIPVKGGLQNYDLYIELGTDIHTRYAGRLAFYNSYLSILLFLILGKPYVMYAESFGPFKGRLDKYVTRYICNRAKLVTVRDGISLGYLKRIGVDNPSLHLTADPAFLFESHSSRERIKEILAAKGIGGENHRLVGLGLSSKIYRHSFPEIKGIEEKKKSYIKLMAALAEHVINTADATVILLPHVMSPGISDIPICEDVMNEIENRGRAVIIKAGDCRTVDELKGIIGNAGFLSAAVCIRR